LISGGSDVLITGCGPIGLFAIPIAKQMGATKGIDYQSNSQDRIQQFHIFQVKA
jgi:threonine dehydrogenase-like Zn-dependent dehydrogenase